MARNVLPKVIAPSWNTVGEVFRGDSYHLWEVYHLFSVIPVPWNKGHPLI